MASASSLHISKTLPLSAAYYADNRPHLCHNPTIKFPDRKKVVPEDILDVRQVLNRHHRRLEVVVKWEGLAESEASWEDWDAIKNQFPNFHLEDKANALGRGIDKPSSGSLTAIETCWGVRSNQSFIGGIMSEMKDPSAETPKVSTSLQIGSPIIIVEAPTMLKTAASVPCLRVNSGLVKAGDVGRIMSRKPKDVWAVRLTIGTYLIDGKYFKPLQLDKDN